MNSVVSSSITMSDDAAMPRNPAEVSDASPKSLMAIRYEASSHDSESCHDSSDHGKSPNYAPSKTLHSGQKSLQTLTRSSSIRAVKILFKKSSFKSKRTKLKCSQMPEDLNVERATCSSTIKDSRFPEHVELEAGLEESESVSFVKVCPYHHCSLNGHCHDPPTQKKPFLRRKRPSSVSHMNVRPSSGSGPGKKISADKKKGDKKQPMTSNAEPRAQLLRGANATIDGSNSIEMVGNGPSYTDMDNQPSLEKIRNSLTQEEDIQEATFELKERTLGCYKKTTEEDKSNTTAFGFLSEGHKTTTSFGDDDNFSNTQSLKYSRMPHDQVSITGDYDSLSKSNKSNPSYITRNLLSSSMDEAKEETNSNQKPTEVFDSASTPATDSETKKEDPSTDSEPAVSLGVRKPQLGKGRSMSMWHLIHKHMASGLAAEGGSNPLQEAHEGRKAEEADKNIITARKFSDVSPDFSDPDMGTYSQDEENQDIEVRKLYAIKLVREAIEKILLPEVQDQFSENQSVTSDIVEDQELSEKNQQEAPEESCQSERGNNPRVKIHNSGQEIKKSEAELGKNSNKKSPSHWSNLKKWILLQRFTKELEKVRKLNLRKPQQLHSETDPGAEKISLRRQTVDGKKRGEEWMLDYALQQVVSQLAPTQKRKVALLVKAFETVVPPQEDSNVQAQDDGKFTQDDSRSGSIHEEHCETKLPQKPVVHESQLSTNTSVKSKLEHLNLRGIHEDKNLRSNSELSPGDSVPSPKKIEKPLNTSRNTIPGQTDETATTENLGSSSLEQQELPLKEEQREFRPEPVLVHISSPLDSPSNHKENETGQFLLDKQNYLTMWHLVCQHVVSSVATKVGIELLGEEDEGTEDHANKVLTLETSGTCKDPPEESHKVAKEIRIASHHGAEFSRSQVLKLVKEAVQEILSPEIQDDSSDAPLVSSEILREKEIMEKDHSKGAKQTHLNSADKKSTRELERGEEGISEKETKENAITAEESKKIELLNKSNSDPPKPKNWSKLKKLMLLKRSIKAMERDRKLKQQTKQQLPLSSDVEPEKVDLRHQMMDERKKAEQWMLDYAVQHIVTKLTPARKQRVAMLVEAFEAVVPLPET